MNVTPEEQKEMDAFCANYKSHLSLEQISEGTVACIENAEQLHEDGVALLNASRFSRAMSIFISGMEEIGKVSVLCSMARIPKNNQSLWKEFWKDFRSHEHKATRAFIHTYDDEARQYPDIILAAAFWQYKLSPLGERLRQAGLYVDFHARDKRWLSPVELIENDATLWLNRLRPALERVKYQASLNLFTPKALTIQREVYGQINANRPKRNNFSSSDYEAIRKESLPAAREYWKRIIKDEILPEDANIEIMGMPLVEFISGT